VLVTPRALFQSEQEAGKPPIIDPKFQSFDTSGLSLDVPGTTDLQIKVTKPKQWKRPKTEKLD